MTNTLAPTAQLIPAERMAEMLQVTRLSLYRWEKQGKLMPVRIGKKVFYNITDVINNQVVR